MGLSHAFFSVKKGENRFERLVTNSGFYEVDASGTIWREVYDEDGNPYYVNEQGEQYNPDVHPRFDKGQKHALKGKKLRREEVSLRKVFLVHDWMMEKAPQQDEDCGCFPVPATVFKELVDNVAFALNLVKGRSLPPPYCGYWKEGETEGFCFEENDPEYAELSKRFHFSHCRLFPQYFDHWFFATLRDIQPALSELQNGLNDGTITDVYYKWG